MFYMAFDQDNLTWYPLRYPLFPLVPRADGLEPNARKPLLSPRL